MEKFYFFFFFKCQQSCTFLMGLTDFTASQILSAQLEKKYDVLLEDALQIISDNNLPGIVSHWFLVHAKGLACSFGTLPPPRFWAARVGISLIY